MSEDGGYKISGLEATIVVVLAAFFDILDIFATLADVAVGAGEVLKILINIIISPILWFWAKMRGVRSEMVLYGGALEMIPIFGNTLPIRTVTIIMIIYTDWHPKTAVVVQTTAKVIKLSSKQ